MTDLPQGADCAARAHLALPWLRLHRRRTRLRPPARGGCGSSVGEHVFDLQALLVFGRVDQFDLGEDVAGIFLRQKGVDAHQQQATALLLILVADASLPSVRSILLHFGQMVDAPLTNDHAGQQRRQSSRCIRPRKRLPLCPIDRVFPTCAPQASPAGFTLRQPLSLRP